ncbi:MAG: hypothetical protein ACRD9R_16425 [Pyrinomonadaceae bacterium]
MGWETRKGREYYYRKERDGGRVRSVYVGRGVVAGLIARLDALDRDEREEQRLLARMEQSQFEAQDAALARLAELAEAVAAGVLLVTGHHTHKRQWRRKRQ